MYLLVSVVCLFALTMQRSVVYGDAGKCKDHTWKYFNHTHSCFKFSSTTKLTWTKAKEACARHQEGHLANIRDKKTKDFIMNEVLTTNVQTWIGLLAWTEYLDITNKSNINDLKRLRKSNQSFVYITKQKLAVGEEPWSFNYICEYALAIPEAETSCPSSPVKANQRPPQPMTCQFFIKNWTYLHWRPRNQFNTDKPDCWKEKMCSRNPKYNGTFDNNGNTTVTYIGNLTRHEEGLWDCAVKKGVYYDKLIAFKSCQVKIYEPAEDLQCETKLKPDSLSISCWTKKIYPKGLCKLWISRKDAYGNFEQMLQNEEVRNSTHIQINPDPITFKSTCFQDLTSRIGSRSASIKITVRMYPNVTGFDLSKTKEAYCEFSEEVEIASPTRPVFHLLSGDKIEQSSLTLPANEDVEMLCLVGGGRPAVSATTIACDFSFGEHKGMQITDKGNSSSIRFNATNDMNGRSCSCWASHITGKSSPTTLEFIVKGDSNGNRGAGNHAGPFNSTTVIIICAGGGAFLVVIVLIIFFCSRKRRRTSMETDEEDEPPGDVNTPDDLAEYAKVNVEGEASRSNEDQRALIEGDTVMFINDVYRSIGRVDQYVKDDDDDYDGTAVCSSNVDENERGELLYANTPCVSNNERITGADGKSAISDLNKDPAKQRRDANELVYVEVEFDETISGSKRKIKVKSEDNKVDYTSIDFQMKAPMDE